MMRNQGDEEKMIIDKTWQQMRWNKVDEKRRDETWQMRRDEKKENRPIDENNKCNKMRGDEQRNEKSIQWRNRRRNKMLTEEATKERGGEQRKWK